MVEKTGIVIIGGGIAGATTAYHLAQRGCRDIVLLEKELLTGTHSSGRNAAMMRQDVSEELNCRLAVESMKFFNNPPAEFPELDFQATGSLVLASGKALAEFHKHCEMFKRVGLEVRFLTPKQAVQIVPVLDESSFEGAFLCPSDGTLDINSLVQGFLQGAQKKGAKVRTQVEVKSILRENGKAVGVQTGHGEIRAEKVINAAGAWASQLVQAAGLSMPIQPCRRHIVVTQALDWVNPKWPFTWHVTAGFYFRPESGGILMSPCDQEESPPCDAQVDPERVVETAEKAIRIIPRIGNAGAVHIWAGLRNMTPDHEFIVGEDPRLKGFYWVAGLGGHGMTASPAIGEVAADLILEGKTTRFDVSDMLPRRFVL